ncbi:unnamed protein product [Rangifer tarandus platyrhynchus]|uniref:Uncharacterized protein n=2 Tax=Rangifer tarandus platyrhynchus TaxID=3082113 RepID=A0AC60A631_RANTA|nr:unnamed protein product [Rangifer tarandus platyrhynchus]
MGTPLVGWGLRGELSTPQQLPRGSSSPAAGRGRRLAEDSASLGSISGPQRKSSRLAGAARLAVPGAMPARLSPSPSWRAGRLGHPERAGRGAAGQAPAASHSVLWASARDLQLTSPKFPAPAPPRPSRRARLGACARTRSPSGRAFSAGAERAEVQGGGGWGGVADGWVGFKEGAPSPQFAGPRWGCSQIAPLLQHWGPLSGPGRQPAAPEATGALCTGSGLGERRVRSAPPSLRTVWLPPPLGSSRRPLPAGAAVVAVLGSSALGGRRRARGGEPRALRRKRGRSPENAGDFS